jgi:hypothetical protein
MVDPAAPHAARVAAAGQLLDRGYGQPHQGQDLNVAGEKKSVALMPAEMSDYQWTAKNIRNAVETLTGGDDSAWRFFPFVGFFHGFLGAFLARSRERPNAWSTPS